MKSATLLTFLLGLCLALSSGSPTARAGTSAGSIWARDNIHAWSVAPFDAVKRTPEERVQMLTRLGFKNYAFSWREPDIPKFDAELDAIQKHGINLVSWNLLSYEVNEAPGKAALEAIKRHNVHPWIWVMQARTGPRTYEDWVKLMPAGMMPATEKELENLPDADKKKIQAERLKITRRLQLESFTRTPNEQWERVNREADRIKMIVETVTPYGAKVALYPHNSWFGMMENQLAILERLKELGITSVGIVYNFNHARDADHDDTRNFPALWKKIQPYVIAVNVTGLKFDGQLIYPSEGDSELEMMRIIENSGWKGPVGVIAEKGGDAEVTLKNYLIGLDWLAAEIRKPGSGGPRPRFQ